MKTTEKYLSSNHWQKPFVLWRQFFHQKQIKVNYMNMIVNINWYQKIGYTIHQKYYFRCKSKQSELEKQWKSKAQKSSKKKTLILGDSIVEHVERWRLNKRMRSTVSSWAIPGATTKAMKYHVNPFMHNVVKWPNIL